MYDVKRVAVVGLGSIARQHRRNLKEVLPSVQIYASSSSGREPTAEDDNIDLFCSDIDLLIQNKAQIAIVASPATFHSRHSIPFIEAGIPVLIEKPVSDNIDDFLRIQNAAESKKTSVGVGYCLRYLSSALIMKKLLSERKVGKIYNAFIEVGHYLPDWRPSKNYLSSVSASRALGGGALLELSHELDYALWLFGNIAPRSSAIRSLGGLGIDVEDSVDVFAVTDKNIILSIHLDFLQAAKNRRCRIIGSEGVLEWDLISNTIQLVGNNGIEVLFNDQISDPKDMYINMLKDFIGLANGSKNKIASLEDSRKVLTLIDEIKSVSITRQAIK